MKNNFLMKLVLLMFCLALLTPIASLAATVTFGETETLSLPSGNSLTVVAGSTVEQLVVNDNSTVALTLGSDTDITIRSANKYNFTESSSSGSFTATAECTASFSQLRITSDSSGAYTLSLDSSTCSISTGGSSSAGEFIPINFSVVINSGDSETETREVNLTLAATNASEIMVANDPNFTGGVWQDYIENLDWTLSSGSGQKTVYVKFRSFTGNESEVINDTIELVSTVAPTSGTITEGNATTTVSLSDGGLTVAVPASAISGVGTLDINPQVSYIKPKGNLGVVGDIAYDIEIMVGDESIVAFSKPITLTFVYNESDITAVDESTLAVYYYSESLAEWVKLGGELDTATNTITVDTSHFTLFAILGETTAPTGDLVSLACQPNADVTDPCKAVYYIGNDGKRYVFPNDKVYFSWYNDFSAIKTVTETELATYQIGGNVTYRPGVKMIKIQSDPKVYAVSPGGVIHWVESEAVASAIFGSDWNKMIDDVSSAFFINYTSDDSIVSASDYDKDVVKNSTVDINTDKGL